MSTLTTDPTLSLNAHFAETTTDPIDARAAMIHGPGDVGNTLSKLMNAIHRVRTILVDQTVATLSERDIDSLVRAATLGVRVIVVAPRPVLGFPPLMVVHEPDFRHALIASIYCMQRGQTLLVFTKQEPNSPALQGIVRQAMRWRASSREPEEGDFLSNPC